MLMWLMRGIGQVTRNHCEVNNTAGHTLVIHISQVLPMSGARQYLDPVAPGTGRFGTTVPVQHPVEHCASLHVFRWAMQNLLDYDVQENLACTTCVLNSCLIEHGFDVAPVQSICANTWQKCSCCP